jgi:uncharacterized damage-inducible protein DinB
MKLQSATEQPSMQSHFALLARYHGWATRRLYEHVDALPEADYRRDAGLFFRSVHGTLNHLLVADGAWFARFARGESPQVVLDAELEPDRVRLRNTLIDGASNWQAFVRDGADERWQSNLHFRRDGETMTLPFAATLAHVFNHGTHHRGQITAAITAMGHDGPVLDIVCMLVEDKESAA